MSSVTERAKEIKQPRGGFVKPSEFTVIEISDGIALNEEENVHGSIIGTVVDYMMRYEMGAKVEEAFSISQQGASIAEKLGVKKSETVAKKLLKGIKGLDDKSITNACKLVTFDVWKRNPMAALMAKNYKDINPDKATIQNIQTLIKRSIDFFKEYGPPTVFGFTFEHPTEDLVKYTEMIETQKGTFGGYTATVDSGDGDFISGDTLWDFKVSKTKPNSQHTLQLLMYWIMGKHSGQEIYKNIHRLGIFNPRLNTVYLLETDKISNEVIETVEDEVICYE